MTKAPKIDLTLLKKLVSELEGHLDKSAVIKENPTNSNADYIVEMSRAIGMATAIMQESTALMGDIGGAVRDSQMPASNPFDMLTKFKPTKN